MLTPVWAGQPENCGIVTGYELDSQGVRVGVPAEARIFTSPCYLDWFWTQPASCPVGIRGSFPRGKAAGA
jgi:hypothetical protein